MTKGLTNRLAFTPTASQRKLLATWLLHTQAQAIHDEPPFDLTKRQWIAVLALLERLQHALEA